MKAIATLVIVGVIGSGCSRDTTRDVRASDNRNEVVALEARQIEIRESLERLRVSVESIDQRLRKIEASRSVEQNAAGAARRGAGPEIQKVTGASGAELLEGGSDQDGDLLRYSKGARLKVGDVIVSSESGSMISDPNRDVIGGDVEIDSRFVSLKAKGAIVERVPGGTAVTADSLEIDQIKAAEPGATDNPDNAQ